MSDRNKTELTQNITRNVALWLDTRGFKPVETEVGVARGWLADVVGVCCPTQTELIDMKLISRPPRWRDISDQPRYAEWRAAMEAIPSPLTATVEVKTSVSDFRGDRKWTATDWPTNLCFVAMPEGMIPQEKWPKGWGVILFSKEGTTVRRSIPSEIRTVSHEQQLNVVLSLAVARDHVTRHARLREFQKKIRIADGERKTVGRVCDAISLVTAVMKGEPVERALAARNIRAKLPQFLLDELRALRVEKPIAQVPADTAA